MRRNKKFCLSVLLCTLVMVLGYAAIAYASGGAAATPIEAPAGKTPAFGNLYVIGWTAVNFFVLLALVYKFGYGPINAMLEQRTNTIEGSLKHAEEVKVEVEQMRKETAANLAESRKEAQEIVGRATKAAEEAKNELLAKAKEEATAMRNKATAEVQAATAQAKVELRDTAVTLAIMAAEKVLSRSINDADQKNMVKQFVSEAGDLLC